jgi:hypothetical protein
MSTSTDKKKISHTKASFHAFVATASTEIILLYYIVSSESYHTLSIEAINALAESLPKDNPRTAKHICFFDNFPGLRVPLPTRDNLDL